MVKSRPYIILSAAISIDGKIATKSGDAKLSSKIDKKRVHQLRSKVDAILIGKNTLFRDDPMLTVRYVKGKNPIRIVLDSHGLLPSKSNIMRTASKIPTIIVTSKKISKKNFNRLKNHNADIIICGKDQVNIKQLLQILVKRNIKKLLVEGGGTVNWQFIKQNLFDEIIVTITPFLIGGKSSITFVQGEGFLNISKSAKLRLTRITRQNNEIVLYYKK